MILIDVGNSRLRAVRAEVTDGRLAGAPTELLVQDTPWDPAGLATLVATVAAARVSAEQVGLTSVVPALTDALVAGLPGIRAVDHTWVFPFTPAVEAPETVGADRWCNVTAAVAAGLSDAIIIDAGTATTIDVLSGGVFEGGLIAPGMAFAARKLQEHGARLWPVPFAPTPLRPGRRTEEALAAGAYHVGVHGIVGTVSALGEQYPDAAVIATGGLAPLLDRPGWRIDPLWTLRGLASLMDT